MEQPLGTQLLLLAATLLTGLGLGAVYDLLRVLRERGGAVLGLLADGAFCCAFALALFLLGMGPAKGTLRLFMPPLALCGAGVWFCLFGAAARRAFRRSLAAGGRLWGLLASPLVRARDFFQISCKKVFSFLQKGFTIIKRRKRTAEHPRRGPGAEPPHASRRGRGRARAGGNGHETETGKHFYEDRDPGHDRLRHGRVAEAEASRASLQAQVDRMLQENAELEYDIDHAGDPDIIAEIARSKLGLVKPGERIFYDLSN